MSGNTEKLLMLLYILLCNLAISIAQNNETTMHSIPLQNETVIPDEYKDLPVVGKCCAEGQMLVINETHKLACVPFDSAINQTFSPLFSKFNASGFQIPGDRHSEFVAIIGDPCNYKRLILEPEISQYEKNYLLLNGSVFMPRMEPFMLNPGVGYCMEIIPEMGLKTVLCLSEDRIVVTASSRFTIYACGLLISVPFLILTIAAYSITPKLRDVYGRALCRYCGCLALAFIMLAVTQLGNSQLSSQACTSIAFVIQFSFIACFFWLNAMCIEMWSLVRSHVDRETYKRMKPRTLFFWYSLWCWCPSVILTLVSMFMDLDPMIPGTYVKSNFDKESCWFKPDVKSMSFFYVSVGLLLLGDVILFILTFVKLTNYQKDLDLRLLARNEESDRRDRRFLRRLTRLAFVSLIICFLFAINWTMDLISWLVTGNAFSWSTFDVVNALQGILIFGIFVLRRPQRDFVWHRIQQLRGVDTAAPEAESMESYLLPILNGDPASAQTIIP
ncbi:putative G-protein coupled receptor Mth-like 1 [Colletes latitarsis]|uniref:putative G-protein coupled receptor Mth-like 1 n=1 Tax=Colletes latitarsis TaxID=2605962 RepID=UPI004035B02F